MNEAPSIQFWDSASKSAVLMDDDVSHLDRF